MSMVILFMHLISIFNTTEDGSNITAISISYYLVSSNGVHPTSMPQLLADPGSIGSSLNPHLIRQPLLPQCYLHPI